MGQREPENEHACIAKSQQGDPAAFESLVGAYQPMIHALTFRMTGSLADAEELVQETFIQAFRQLSSFRAESKFSSWLYRIAINLCLNGRSRRQRQEKILTAWGEQYD